MNRLAIIFFLTSPLAFAQINSSSELVEKCSYEIAVETLTVVKETVGLRNEKQVEAMYDLAKRACVDNNSAIKNSLDANGVREAINKALSRALTDVFLTKSI